MVAALSTFVRYTPPVMNCHPRSVRRVTLEQSNRTQVGHIRSALSIADIIAALYGCVLHIPDTRDPQRDRFVLSKGHAARALYVALFLKGWLSKEQLDTFCTDGTLRGVHPVGIDFSTGSLGHGLPMTVRAAIVARLEP